MRENIVKLLMSKEISMAPFILENYQQLGLNNDELVLFLLMSNQYTDIPSLARIMGVEELEIIRFLQDLTDKNLVRTEQLKLASGKIDIAYSFEPLFHKAATLLLRLEKENPLEEKESSVNLSFVVESIEQEFGRVLTPMELTMVQDWVAYDGYTSDLILVALKEASLSQVRNLKYIQRILDTWKDKNIRSAQEAEEQARQYRKKKSVATEVDDVMKTIVSQDTLKWFN